MPMDEDKHQEDVTKESSEDTNASVSTSPPTTTKPAVSSPKGTPSVKLPLPTLTFEELDDKQKEAYTHCVEFLGFSSSHVLRAFQECRQKANVFDIEEWCENNKDQSAKHPDDTSEVHSESEGETPYESEAEESDYDADMSLAPGQYCKCVLSLCYLLPQTSLPR